MKESQEKQIEVHKLFVRNIGTLSCEEQGVICNTKIGIAGCGMGSEVARQLTRFGFSLSGLADPDTVELHNLNRQSYHQEHVGKKKVLALFEKLQSINPDQQPELFLDGITIENYKHFVEISDIVIDGIDPNHIEMSILLTREAYRQGKPVVTAIDFGFGARLFVFLPHGMDIMEFMGLDPHTSDATIQAIPLEKIMTPYMKDIPQYALELIMATVSGELAHYPQNILAVAQSAVMIAAACKRIALKQPITSVPGYTHIDPDLIIQPGDAS